MPKNILVYKDVQTFIRCQVSRGDQFQCSNTTTYGSKLKNNMIYMSKPDTSKHNGGFKIWVIQLNLKIQRRQFDV